MNVQKKKKTKKQQQQAFLMTHLNGHEKYKLKSHIQDQNVYILEIHIIHLYLINK